MAKKKESTSNGASATTRFSGTITWNNVSLADDDVEAIDNWQIDTGDLLGEIAVLVENGYDLSSKFEDRSQSLAVYLTSMRLALSIVVTEFQPALHPLSTALRCFCTSIMIDVPGISQTGRRLLRVDFPEAGLQFIHLPTGFNNTAPLAATLPRRTSYKPLYGVFCCVRG